MSFEEDKRGSREARKQADLVILSHDYMTVADQDISEIVYAEAPFDTH